MEVVTIVPDQTISPSKRKFKNPKRFNPRHTPNINGSLMQVPPFPSLSYSYPPSFPNFNPSYFHHGLNLHQQKAQQPPLLPLPISNRLVSCSSLPTTPRNLGISCPPPTNRKQSNQALTPKKSSKLSSSSSSSSSSFSTSPKKETVKPTRVVDSKSVGVDSVTCLGPDPKKLPNKDVVSRVLLGNSNTSFGVSRSVSDVDTFSGCSVFTISPHPSSLPLPKFSMRPKLSCNAEAAGVDAGATDDLRRLLRLR